MSITQIAMKDWKAVCPKCSHVEYSEEGKNCFCGNCNAPAIMTYGQSSNGWQSNEAELSWRQLQCSKSCGWTLNNVTCSECGTTIKGIGVYTSLLWFLVPKIMHFREVK